MCLLHVQVGLACRLPLCTIRMREGQAMMDRDTAEQVWRRAFDTMFGNLPDWCGMQAEEEAWHKYAKVCDELGQCREPGCRRRSPHFSARRHGN
jgi:hypothetical protein